ncbi:MAG: tetratricopeptide repeat protein [Anaerolineales bacterium]|nr:tetratricopeptide repeat protein [Anaerolineales bacterium]
MAETVLVDVQKDFDLQSLGNAIVTADFIMRNLGNASESMAVRFPIAAQNGRFEYPEIADLKISVDRKKIEHRRTSFPDEGDPSQMIPWAEFDITFPPGQDVSIQVKYKLKGSGYAPYTAFYYILESGAGWKDTIGSADIILRLPYEANPQNVVIGLQIGWAQTTPGGVFQGNEVRWHFDNFEPGPHEAIHNMEFALVAPSVWNNLLIARANVTKSPNDSEAWGQLGKAYKSVFLMHKYYRDDDAGKELYKLAIEAYEKCLALNPKDAQWHAGFADLLANHAFWNSFFDQPNYGCLPCIQ